MTWLDQLAPWAAQLGINSLKAVPLILLLVSLQKWASRWISPRGIKLLWFLALVRLFMPEIAGTPASVYNLLQRPHPLVAAPPAIPDYAAESKPGWLGPVYSFTPPVPTVSAAPHPFAAAPTGENVAPTVSPSWSRAEIATAVWLAGVVMMMTLLAGQSWRFHHQFAGLPACTDPGLLDLLEECRKEAGIIKPVALIVSDAVAVPALYRLFRPRILLPSALNRSLDRAQLRCIFQHELAHVSGGDIALNWLVTLAVAVHWFNPFVWLMARSVAQAREMACDRVVLEQRTDPQVYGETIVRVAESLLRSQIIPGVAAIAESRNALKERIRKLTQKQGRYPWLATSAAALVLGVLFLSSAVQASIPMAVTVPGLPGAGIGLADALGRADILAVGQVVSVKYEGTDAKTDRYRVKINVVRDLIPNYVGTWIGPTPPIEGEVRVINPAFLGNIVSGDDIIPVVQEKIPEDGQEYFCFVSTDKKAKSNLIFKMLPGAMVLPSAIPEFPEKRETLAHILANRPQNIVIGRFVKMRPRFATVSVNGPKIEWRQEEKAVIDVKKTVRGQVAPGLIEGDSSYSGSGSLETGIGPLPALPDTNKDYLFFLSYIEPSENVQEDLIHGNDLARNYIFYLSPGRPSETSCNINKVLPVDSPAETKASAPALPPSLPLGGRTLSPAAAEAQAETIVVGHVVGMTAFFDNRPVVDQAVNIAVLKTLRGKARGAAQYGVRINIGKESAPEVGKDYVFFLSHYSAVLRIEPANAYSELPETH